MSKRVHARTVFEAQDYFALMVALSHPYVVRSASRRLHVFALASCTAAATRQLHLGLAQHAQHGQRARKDGWLEGHGRARRYLSLKPELDLDMLMAANKYGGSAKQAPAPDTGSNPLDALMNKNR